MEIWMESNLHLNIFLLTRPIKNLGKFMDIGAHFHIAYLVINYKVLHGFSE